ncbi:MAG TPA: DoxX family membrane protein [Thermoanaerobaculia bacterium]|nr:DoxX family membrane protein [Thermoanaerobaculia bacterium]
MIPLIVLVVAILVFRGLGAWRVRSLDSWPAATRAGLAVMFCFTATAHFTAMRHDLVKMVPAWVPNPELVVYLTGVCEIAGGLGLLFPRTRRIAAVALILFLIAVFPANVHAAQAGVLLRGQPATPLVPRALMQLLFIALTWWSGFLAARR